MACFKRCCQQPSELVCFWIYFQNYFLANYQKYPGHGQGQGVGHGHGLGHGHNHGHGHSSKEERHKKNIKNLLIVFGKFSVGLF